jgi:hypothetical protein
MTDVVRVKASAEFTNWLVGGEGGALVVFVLVKATRAMWTGRSAAKARTARVGFED